MSKSNESLIENILREVLTTEENPSSYVAAAIVSPDSIKDAAQRIAALFPTPDSFIAKLESLKHPLAHPARLDAIDECIDTAKEHFKGSTQG